MRRVLGGRRWLRPDPRLAAGRRRARRVPLPRGPPADAGRARRRDRPGAALGEATQPGRRAAGGQRHPGQRPHPPRHPGRHSPLQGARAPQDRAARSVSPRGEPGGREGQPASQPASSLPSSLPPAFSSWRDRPRRNLSPHLRPGAPAPSIALFPRRLTSFPFHHLILPLTFPSFLFFPAVRFTHSGHLLTNPPPPKCVQYFILPFIFLQFPVFVLPHLGLPTPSLVSAFLLPCKIKLSFYSISYPLGHAQPRLCHLT